MLLSRKIADARSLAVLLASWLCVGCSAFPDITHQPTFHNPFPQLSKVAVLPFYNQSNNPNIKQDELAIAYYTELQQIPGFEVMPVGVVKQAMAALQFEPHSAADFQKLAQLLKVDAVIVGSITEYTPYYPPRLGLSVNWYAANPGFHPIPAGYGLPWGTADEEYIPEALVKAAEFELAREQLKTQTPEVPLEYTANPLRPVEKAIPPPSDASKDTESGPLESGTGEPRSTLRNYPSKQVARVSKTGADTGDANKATMPLPLPSATDANKETIAEILPEPMPLANSLNAPVTPENWPDPRGFVPPAPCPQKPEFKPFHGAIITHTKLYDGHDADFTQALANYFYYRDDERFGGWQGYLHRTSDFTRFCCYLHITETLSARGGSGESRVVYRWPIGRYER